MAIASDLPVTELRKRLLAYQERQQMAFRRDDIPAANQHLLHVMRYAGALAGTPRGKDALEELVKSPLAFVRLRAAQYVLDWNPEIAIPVLGRLLVETFDPEVSIGERLELRLGARLCLYTFFGIEKFDRNELIEPLKAYGIDLPYRDRRKWE